MTHIVADAGRATTAGALHAADVRRANASWEALFRAQSVLTRRFAAEDVWGPVRMREYDVLYTLAKASCSLRMTELNHDVLLSQPALSRMVERMERRGLVRRTSAQDDGRGVLVSLTDEGRELQRRIGRAHARSVTARLSAALTDAEMDTLRTLCERLAAVNENLGDPFGLTGPGTVPDEESSIR